MAVLDDVEHVEEGRPLRGVHLVPAERALAGHGIDPPYLDCHIHLGDLRHGTGVVTSITVEGVGGSTSTVAPKSESFIVSRMCARIAWFVYALVV